MNLKYFLIVFLLCQSLSHAGKIKNINESLAEKIPSLFGLPEGEFIISDLRGSDSDLLLALLFSPKERVYATVSIAASESGSDSLQKISNMVKLNAALPSDHSSYGVVKKKLFSNEMIGYWGLGGFGPGGEETLIFVEWPSKNIDIFCKLSVPGDPPLKIDDNNQPHLKIIDQGIDENLAEQLAEVFQETFAEYVPSKNESKDPLQVEDRIKSEPIEKASQVSKPAPKEEPAAEPEEEASPQYLPWVLGILILLTVVGFTLRSRKNP